MNEQTTQPIDLIAKLLANENINVVRANVSTAAFDIQARTLILPQWKNMSPAVDQMLVAHEVSHALFTTKTYMEALENELNFKYAREYLNILEDARVEKHMKRRYLGIRKTFSAGYKELADMDFFGVKTTNIAALPLIDRINLWFKVGFTSGVQFTNEERVFVVRAEGAETERDVIDLARDIFEFEKAAREEAAVQRSMKSPDPEDLEDDMDFEEGDGDEEYEMGSSMPYGDDEGSDGESGDDSDTADGDSDEESDNTDGEEKDGAESELESKEKSARTVSTNEGTVNDTTEEISKPVTNANLEERVAELADTKTIYKYWKLAPVAYDPVVSYKQISSEIAIHYDTPIGPSSSQQNEQFKRDTQNNVDYLVKEFEMRKAATAYKRAQTSKIGSLDMRKIWSYKLNDDLFKRVTTVKQGKNHGMVFLLDWSGSMSDVIMDTIDQVINLAMFCSQAQIPYQVFAFTDINKSKGGQDYRELPLDHRTVADGIIDVSGNGFALLELFSNKMTKSEFNLMVNNLRTRRVARVNPLHGTPLNEALVYMYDYIGKFQAANNVEKVSFITLTDGEGTQIGYFKRYVWSADGAVNIKHFIMDEYSKVNRAVSDHSASQTTTLLEMIKARYNCAVLGFYITSTSARDIRNTITAHYDRVDDMYGMVDRVKSDMKSQGYASLSNTGRDELFILPQSATRIQNGELNVDATANARSIASKFTKYMTTKKTSRVLLNKFIGHVA